MESEHTASPQATLTRATEQAMQSLQLYLAGVTRHPYKLAALGISSPAVVERMNTYGAGNIDALQTFQRSLLAYARPSHGGPNVSFGAFLADFAADERRKLHSMIADVEGILEHEQCAQLTAVRALHAELDENISTAVVAFQAVVGLERSVGAGRPGVTGE